MLLTFVCTLYQLKDDGDDDEEDGEELGTAALVGPGKSRIKCIMRSL